MWLKVYMGPSYGPMIKKIQGEDMKPNYLYAALSYILLAIGLIYFVLPNISEENLLKDSLRYGFLFGIIVYGVYDFTAAAVIKDWDIKLAIIDILWGGVLYFLTAYLSKKV